MAGANFDADDPGMDGFDDFAPEEIQANLPGDETNKARLLLERFMRDFEKSMEKKVIGLESRLAQFEGKKAPSTKDLTDLQEAVDLLLEKQIASIKQLDIQVEKEFDGIETRLKTQNGLREDYQAITDARIQIDVLLENASELLTTAAKSIVDRGQERIRKMEEEQALAEQEDETRRKLILDRYINDFEKSLEKKLIGLQSRIDSFGLRDAPRAEDPERLEQLVDGMLKKQMAIASQLASQVDKEFESIKTRIETQGGSASDLAKVAATKAEIDKLLAASEQKFKEAAKEIQDRGLDKIDDKNEKSARKIAAERAQAAGEQVFNEILENSREVLDPTIKETAMAVIGDLIGPYSAIRKDADGRYQRRQEALDKANEEAAKKAQEVYERTLQEELNQRNQNKRLDQQYRSQKAFDRISRGEDLSTSSNDFERSLQEELNQRNQNKRLDQQYRSQNAFDRISRGEDLSTSSNDFERSLDAAMKSGILTKLEQASKLLQRLESSKQEGDDYLDKLRQGIDPPDSDFQYQQKAPGEGFRLQDIPSMARFVRGSTPFIAATAIMAGTQMAGNKIGEGVEGLTNPDQSIMQAKDNIFLGYRPISIQGIVLDKILRQAERIAENTTQQLLPFSNVLMDTAIDSQLKLLEQSFRRADRMDVTLAGLMESKTELQMALNEAGDKLLQELAPYLIGTAQILTVLVKNGSGMFEWLVGALEVSNPILAPIIELLWSKGQASLKQLQQDQANAMKAGVSAAMDFSAPGRNDNLPKIIM
mgnify:CR=1 FL=1